MWHGADGMGWWMLFGSVWFIFFWGIVIWAVVRLTQRGERSDEEPTALSIAKRRYARGEISREEYEQLRRDLAS